MLLKGKIYGLPGSEGTVSWAFTSRLARVTASNARVFSRYIDRVSTGFLDIFCDDISTVVRFRVRTITYTRYLLLL